jgi:hypothetical protein
MSKYLRRSSAGVLSIMLIVIGYLYLFEARVVPGVYRCLVATSSLFNSFDWSKPFNTFKQFKLLKAGASP